MPIINQSLSEQLFSIKLTKYIIIWKKLKHHKGQHDYDHDFLKLIVYILKKDKQEG